MRLRAVLSANLKRLRAERRLTQEALALTADIERSYVSRLERRLSGATVDVLEKLAEALQIDASELVRDSELTPADRTARSGPGKAAPHATLTMTKHK